MLSLADIEKFLKNKGFPKKGTKNIVRSDVDTEASLTESYKRNIMISPSDAA